VRAARLSLRRPQMRFRRRTDQPQHQRRERQLKECVMFQHRDLAEQIAAYH